MKADSSLKCMGNANVNLLNDDLTTKRVGPKLLHTVKHSLWGGPPFVRENVVKACQSANTQHLELNHNKRCMMSHDAPTFRLPRSKCPTSINEKKHTTVTPTSATHFLPIVPFACSWSNPPSLHLPRLWRQFSQCNKHIWCVSWNAIRTPLPATNHLLAAIPALVVFLKSVRVGQPKSYSGKRSPLRHTIRRNELRSVTINTSLHRRTSTVREVMFIGFLFSGFFGPFRLSLKTVTSSQISFFLTKLHCTMFRQGIQQLVGT